MPFHYQLKFWSISEHNPFCFGVCEDSSSTSATMAEKEEVDSRSIYVGNVSCSPSTNAFPSLVSFILFMLLDL